MKSTTLLILLCAVLACPGCLTLTGQVTLPAGERSGGFGGSITGQWLFPSGGKVPVQIQK
jgi:hypothetical protein